MGSFDANAIGRQPVIKSVVNGNGRVNVFNNSAMRAGYFPATLVLSGALTAGVLATALSITGKGFLDVAGIIAENATARTLRMQIILDGITVWDTTSASITTAYEGLLAIGSLTQATITAGLTNIPSPVPCYFAQTCVVKFASSLTETDLATVFYAYRLVA